jgi:lysophospholipase L1-like esterase
MVIFRFLAVALGLALAVVTGEVALRLMGMPRLTPAYGDPVLGFTTLRNTTSTYYFPEYGGFLTMRSNNFGFHQDEDTKVQKAPGTTRVVVVGDSQTAGECANSENYPNVLDRLLNSSGRNGRYEVIDAGVGRYSPYQYYIRTEHDLLPLKPDRVIVGIYMGNDLMDLIRRDDRPYLTLNADGTVQHHPPEFVVTDDPYEPPSALMSSRLYGLFRNAVGSRVRYQMTRARMLVHDITPYGHGPIDAARYMIDVKRLADISLGFMTQSLLQQVWFQHFPETLPLALRLNREVIAKFKKLCDRNGIRLAYVLIPTKLLIEPSDFQDVLEQIARYDSRLQLPALQAFENQVTDEVVKSCSDLGVEVIDLRKPLLGRGAGRRFYNPLEMHLTPEGNRAIAYTLYTGSEWGPGAGGGSQLMGSRIQGDKLELQQPVKQR